MKLTIEVEYSAQVFPGDPDDRYEIAELEQDDLGPKIEDYLVDLLGVTFVSTIKVEPKL